MISALVGHVLLWIRGCRHPKQLDTGIFFSGEDGTMYLTACACCGAVIKNEIQGG